MRKQLQQQIWDEFFMVQLYLTKLATLQCQKIPMLPVDHNVSYPRPERVSVSAVDFNLANACISKIIVQDD